MVLYLDTSALVKLYFEEPGDDLVFEAVQASARICTSSIAYAEARATFARKWREGRLTSSDLTRAIDGFNSDWRTFARLNVSNALAYEAGSLAQELALRGYDAVHLATALRFAGEEAALQFLSFDSRLNEAARSASLRIYGEAADAASDGGDG